MRYEDVHHDDDDHDADAVQHHARLEHVRYADDSRAEHDGVGRRGHGQGESQGCTQSHGDGDEQRRITEPLGHGDAQRHEGGGHGRVGGHLGQQHDHSGHDGHDHDRAHAPQCFHVSGDELGHAGMVKAGSQRETAAEQQNGVPGNAFGEEAAVKQHPAFLEVHGDEETQQQGEHTHGGVGISYILLLLY